MVIYFDRACSVIEPVFGPAPSRSQMYETVWASREYGNSDLDGNEAFLKACQAGDYSEVKRMLGLRRFRFFRRIRVNYRDEQGVSPIIAASRGGHLEIAELLIANRSWVNVPTADVETALMAAASAGSAELASLLIKQGAKTDICKTDGKTALMLAARAGHMDVVRVLVDQGAGVNQQNPQNQETALTYAATESFYEICRFLLSRGADESSLSPLTLDVITVKKERRVRPDGSVDPFVSACLDVDYRELRDDRWFSDFEELSQISSLEERGEKQQALTLCELGMEKYPDSFHFYVRAALLNDELGQPGLAEEVLNRGLQKSLSKCSIALTIADREHEKGNYPEVVRWWITAGVIQLESDLMVETMPFLNLAYVCQILGLGDAEGWLFGAADRAGNDGPIRLNAAGVGLRHQVARGILSGDGQVAQLAIVEFHNRYG